MKCQNICIRTFYCGFQIGTYFFYAVIYLFIGYFKLFCTFKRYTSPSRWKWCYKNSAKCGHGEVEFPDAGCKYMPIRSNKKTVGVVSIDCTQNELTDEAEECVIALLSQITIAIERAELEAEKQSEADLRAREHLKATVTKNISHDMYPRAKAIYESAKAMRENMNLMENDEILERLRKIEDESDYIAQTVDNLLDINKDR